jgi:cytochrome c-type biogenesis protein CcmH/NrfF
MRWTSVTLGLMLTTAAGLIAQQPASRGAAQARDTIAIGHDLTQASQLYGSLMSPFCPGLTLATCPSAQAETLRVWIRTRLEAGEPPDAIVTSLVATYGEGIRGAPRARGIGLALWLLPVASLVFGGAALLWWLRARAATEAADPSARAPAPALTAADRALLEAERRLLD